MNILLIEPMKTPRAIQIPPGLESLQKAVGGDIEALYPFREMAAVITNGEGKNLGLPLNRAFRDENGVIYDIIAGNMLIVGLGEESFSDLPPDLMHKYSEQFKDPETFMKIGGQIIAIKCPRPEEQKRKPVRRKHDMDAR